jgi:periplasmic copper chaperone A
MLRIHVLGCALLSAFIALPASAHVTLEQNAAPVGAPYKAIFKVPHGCDGSSTIQLTVQIPEGVIAVKPMVKTGWDIETMRGPYARSYSYFHGAKFDQGVKEVTWSGGRLPDAFYDEFVLSVFIAADLSAGQNLYFPVVQTCEKGEHRWIEVPMPAKSPEGDPAPAVKLLPRT